MYAEYGSRNFESKKDIIWNNGSLFVSPKFENIGYYVILSGIMTYYGYARKDQKKILSFLRKTIIFINSDSVKVSGHRYEFETVFFI